MKLDEIMIDRVITVYAGATVKDAVYLMNKYGIGCLIVQEKMKPIGVITERDLMKRVLAKSRNPEEITVREVMSTPLVTGRREMDVEDATRLMLEQKIKKLPIIDNGRLMGIVSLTDLISSQPDVLGTVKEITAAGYTPKRIRKVVDYYVDMSMQSILTEYSQIRKLRE